MTDDHPAAWVELYRQRGWAVARLLEGEKKPNYRRWPTFSLEPADFAQGDNVAILLGLLSAGLVCVDLDGHDAIHHLADRYLPPTLLVEGRAGKPRGHRFYVASDVPPELEAHTHLVQGGPKTCQWARTTDKVMLVELRGTGSAVTVPPSWTSQEQRQWVSFGRPALVPYAELVACCERLACDCGHVRRERSLSNLDKIDVRTTDEIDQLRLLERGRRYLAQVPPAISGQRGHRHTLVTAMKLATHLPPLGRTSILVLLGEWNRSCQPPWTADELEHKVDDALRMARR